MSGRVVIAGAGILGLATAHALVELGVRDVVVVERSVPGAGASGRSGALVRSNYDNAVEARLAEHALCVYRAFGERVGGDAGFRQVGLLVMVPPEKALAASRLAEAQRGWGVGIGAIDAQSARGLAPHLRTDDAGLVLHQADAGVCDAGATLASYHRVLRDAGVRFMLSCPAGGVTLRGGRAVGLETAQGPVEADAVVLAAGVWTNGLLPAGVDLALVPHLTRVARFRPMEFDGGDFPSIIDTTQDAWFRPLPGGEILVGSETGVVADTDPEAIPSVAPNALVESYRAVLARRFRVSPDAAPRGAWAGAFMLSPDHRPLVGALSAYEGLYIAGGDSGGAFKTAPALGLGLAETIVHGAARSVDIAALAPARLLAASPAFPAAGVATVSR